MLDVHMAIRMEQQLLMENDFLQGVVKQFYIEKEYIRNLMRHVCYIVPNLLNFTHIYIIFLISGPVIPI